MPEYIIELYLYFLVGGQRGREAFDRFYQRYSSREFVRRFANKHGKFWSDYMTRYSREIREQHNMPFEGVMTPRGIFK